MCQKPIVRWKQKSRRTRQLAKWRAKNETEQQPVAEQPKKK